MNMYVIIGEANTGKTTVLRHLMAFAHNCPITSTDINVRKIRTATGVDIDVGMQSYSALQEENVSCTDFTNYINKLTKRPDNIIVALREKGCKRGPKKTGWNASDYIAHFTSAGWNVASIVVLDNSGIKKYASPNWQSIQSINNGIYIASNKVADDVSKYFNWI